MAEIRYSTRVAAWFPEKQDVLLELLIGDQKEPVMAAYAWPDSIEWAGDEMFRTYMQKGDFSKVQNSGTRGNLSEARKMMHASGHFGP